MLEQEAEFFEAHKDEILRAATKPFIVIVGTKVVAEYDTQEMALKESYAKYALGSFMIKDVRPEALETVHRFHSRVAFRG